MKGTGEKKKISVRRSLLTAKEFMEKRRKF